MWKNHETFDFGKDEAWVDGTYREILSIEKESTPITEDDVAVIDGIEFLPLEPGKQIEEIQKLCTELFNAENEVLIMDPYLVKVDEVFELLTRYINNNVKIKILTARTRSNKLKTVLDMLMKKGYNISILRYFDREKKVGKETILHDRYIIIDRKKVIELGKGLNTIIEANDYKSKDNVIVKIITSKEEVDKYVSNFMSFWNYDKSNNDIIIKFPKERYGVWD